MNKNQQEILKTKFPDVYKELMQLKNGSVPEVKAEQARNGDLTLTVLKGEKPYSLHSQYNPTQEAERIITTHSDVSEKHVLFYGVGLGYHIEAFMRMYPNTPFSVIEPYPEILEQTLLNEKGSFLQSHQLQFLYAGQDEEKIISFLEKVLKSLRREIHIIPLPSYQNIFAQEFEGFLKHFRKQLSKRREYFYAGLSFEERLTINTLVNMRELFTTPNVLHDLNQEDFEGKPAIIISAGPSLNDEIEWLRYIKEHRLAYLFAVGSAINTLLSHQILPDAVFTYDPQKVNAEVFKKVKDLNIQIPLIFGSSVGYETLEDYSGIKMHVLINQEMASSFFLKRKNGEELKITSDAGSIAVIAFQVLNMWKSNPIILVGQNLAYRGDQRYASGIDYVRKTVSEQERNYLIEVEDVYGNMTLTNVGFDLMRKDFEILISITNQKVINTTKGGAKIKGAEFLTLEEVIQSYLNEPVVKPNWFIGKKYGYDEAYLFKQIQKMEEELNQLEPLLMENKKLATQLKHATDQRKLEKIGSLINKLDGAFKRFLQNQAFRILIMPMTRTHIQLFFEQLEEVRHEPHPVKKGEQISREFHSYLGRCERVYKEVLPYFEEMKSRFRKEFLIV